MEYTTREKMDGINNSFWDYFVIPTIRKIKENKCEICGSKKCLDLHHTSYEKVNINTLKLLCRKCHKQQHKN